jgi:Winged helix-turn helix
LIHFPILPKPLHPKEAIRMNVRYRVDLDQPERDELTAMLRSGKHPARKLKRAQILLAADAGLGDEAIAATVVVGGSTVYRTKRRFVELGLEAALSEEPRPGGGAQADRQGGGLAGGHGLLQPAAWPQPLDAGPAGRRIRQADRA